MPLCGVALVFALSVPAIIAIIKTPEEVGCKPFGTPKVNMKSLDENLTGPDYRCILKNVTLWIMVIGLIAVGFLNLNFESYAPTFWQENGMTVTATSVYLSIYYLLGAALTAFAGVVAQKYGAKVYITYLCVAFIIGIIMNLILGGGNNQMIFMIICTLMMSASFALYSSVPGTVTTEAYGNRSFSKVCTWLTAAYSIGQLIGPLQFSYTLDSTGSWTTSFISLIIVGVVAIVCVLIGLFFSPMAKQNRNKF